LEVLIVGTIIEAYAGKEVEVACVHASRPIYTSSEMTSEGYTPSRFDVHYLGHPSLGAAIQAAIWNEVRLYTSSVLSGAAWARTTEDYVEQVNRISASCDDLAQAFRLHKSLVDDVVKAVPQVENQVGVVLLGVEGCQSIECFNLKQSWDAVRA